jgi:hypothetical protein
VGQNYAEGQEPGSSSVDLPPDGTVTKQQKGQSNGNLWRPEDESYYGGEAESTASSSGRWHYPANFEDAALVSGSSKRGKKKKEKKDRWARTEDAYSISEEQSQRKKKKKKKRSSVPGNSVHSRESSTEFPEAAEGGLYGDRNPGEEAPDGIQASGTMKDDVFDHQF